MRYWLILLLLAAFPAPAEQTGAQGWEEAVLSVADLAAVRDFLVAAGGFEVLHQGPVDGTRLSYWGLPSRAGAREAVLGETGDTRGRIRLLEFSGVERRPMRRWSQPWDTGGWFALAFWVNDLDGVSALAERHHWHGLSEPVRGFAPDGTPARWQMLRNADGVVIGLYQALLGPTGPGGTDVGGLSSPFAAIAVVEDLDAAAAYYDADLGTPARSADARRDRTPPLAYGLPANLGDTAARRLLRVHPPRPGQVMLLHWDALRGRDFAAHAHAPNRGLLALTYRVASVAELEKRLEANGVEPEAGPVSVVLPPHGIVNVLRVRAPDGALTEFFSVRP